MYKIIVTKNAQSDLDSIIEYISIKLDNKSAASAFIENIYESYKHIENNPKLYAMCNDSRLRDLQYRRAIIKNYIMIYRIEEAVKTVYILRFFYGKQDYERFL